MKRSGSDIIWLIIKYIAMILFAVSCLFPIYWLLLSSFKSNQELYVNTWGLPKTFSFVNYRDAIITGGILRYFGNSAIIAVSVVMITSILATMASYAITRMDWKLSKFVYTLFLMGMMVPIYGLIIPLFSILDRKSVV
jgi:raffinose/stachyose/melibiose transport system permease protein